MKKLQKTYKTCLENLTEKEKDLWNKDYYNLIYDDSKLGDRIFCYVNNKEGKFTGEIKTSNPPYYSVLFDDGEEAFVFAPYMMVYELE